MLRFFRQIRQRLLTDNKFSKYLLYAVGEILLVVFGILIALQIDNWNENRKSHIEDIKFLKNIRDELVLDTLALVDITSTYIRINGNLKKTLQYLEDTTEITKDKREIMSRALKNLEVLTPIYKNIEKNNAKLSEGILLNINNQLNNKYQQYLEYIKSTNDIVTKFGETLQLIVMNDVHPNVDLDFTGRVGKVNFNIEELRNNRLVKNAIHKSIRYRDTYIFTMNEQKVKAVEILDLLDKELK
jgi:hypothetical protein